MVSILPKAFNLIFLFAATISVAQLPPWECPATESNHLCCVAFGKFGDLGDHCGIEGVNPSTPTASGYCTSAYNPCLQGSVAACCESVLRMSFSQSPDVSADLMLFLLSL
ncbi:hypothetical protein EWM64_g4632 [Hericium alpestre]|uniref:Hydrophobin n=1 Tax=Hericium alpestre TaxID=135208 RepID=A0A4Y9ZYV4_9AGAM|nr:hypothetical protein EWM64_g4632 [Hericium alpestre]